MADREFNSVVTLREVPRPKMTGPVKFSWWDVDVDGTYRRFEKIVECDPVTGMISFELKPPTSKTSIRSQD